MRRSTGTRTSKSEAERAGAYTSKGKVHTLSSGEVLVCILPQELADVLALCQDKQALEQQQLSSRLQISALQSKLDETRHCYHDNMRDPTQELKDALDTAQQSLQSKEQEVC